MFCKPCKQCYCASTKHVARVVGWGGWSMLKYSSGPLDSCPSKCRSTTCDSPESFLLWCAEARSSPKRSANQMLAISLDLIFRTFGARQRVFQQVTFNIAACHRGGPAAIISNIVPCALLRIANIMKHCLRAPLLAPSPDWSLDTRALLALPAWEFTGDDLRICSSWEICHATHQMRHCIGLRAKSCLLFELRLCNNLVTQAQTYLIRSQLGEAANQASHSKYPHRQLVFQIWWYMDTS